MNNDETQMAPFLGILLYEVAPFFILSKNSFHPGRILPDIHEHPNVQRESRRVKSEMRDTSGLMFMGNARLIQGVSLANDELAGNGK